MPEIDDGLHDYLAQLTVIQLLAHFTIMFHRTVGYVTGVDTKILDYITGSEFSNKRRFVVRTLDQIFAGTNRKPEEFLIISGKTIAVEKHAMLLVIQRGGKGLPWNKARRDIVQHFFGPYVIPFDSEVPLSSTVYSENQPIPNQPTIVEQPENASTRKRKCRKRKFETVQTTILKRPIQVIDRWSDPERFWKDVLQYATKATIPFSSLITFIKKIPVLRRKHKYTNYVKLAIDGLFPEVTTVHFRESLAMKMTTGNINEVMDLLRNGLRIKGVRGKNIIPGRTRIKQSRGTVVKYFNQLCRPEKCKTGFRVDLTTAVKLAMFIEFGHVNLADINVDIWGDGCEIGGEAVTRLCFRLLSSSTRSAQSVNSVFCFAAFYGKETDHFFFNVTQYPPNVSNDKQSIFQARTLEPI